MKYAAQVVDGIVCAVIVVDEIQWAVDNIGGTWIETFADGSVRGKYACVGDIYDPDLDVFMSPPEAVP